MNRDKIKVSVVVLCYNQENYIQKALDSILNQKTDFAFEIIIGDDASSDNTPVIVAKYAKKYSDIIRAVLREKNLKPTRNLYELLTLCTGRYIALLEGDDYWIDENKLQIQYELLENNSRYIACTHGIQYIDQNDRRLEKESSLYQFKGQTYTLDIFLNNSKTLPGHTGTMFFRNFFRTNNHDWTILYRAHDFMGDVTLNLMLLTQGDIVCLQEKMSTFRVIVEEKGTNWASVHMKRNMESEYLIFRARQYEWYINNFDITKSILFQINQNYYLAIRYFLKKPSKDRIKVVKDVKIKGASIFGIISYFFQRVKNVQNRS